MGMAQFKSRTNIRKQILHEQLLTACCNEDLETVKYLLTSPELDQHADIHLNYEEAFRNVCHKNDRVILNYLIFDYCIPMTQSIKTYLCNTNGLNNIGNETVSNLFALRELNTSLGQQLDFKSEKSSQSKI